jgi:hypothetical protein
MWTLIFLTAAFVSGVAVEYRRWMQKPVVSIRTQDYGVLKVVVLDKNFRPKDKSK